MIEALQEGLPKLIKCYPSSNPATTQRALAEVLSVDPEDLIVGNGATELIVLINEVLVDRIGVSVPTFGEYIEKLRDPAAAELFVLDRDQEYRLDLNEYLAWGRERGVKALLIINPGNPTGQLHSLDQMVDFLERARDMDLIVVDESFIDFAGDPIPSLLPVADRFNNLLIVRSMSKHYGVPGLRLGLAQARVDWGSSLRARTIPPRRLPNLSLVAASRLATRRSCSRWAEAPAVPPSIGAASVAAGSSGQATHRTVLDAA